MLMVGTEVSSKFVSNMKKDKKINPSSNFFNCIYTWYNTT